MKTEQLKEWGLDDRQISMVMRENGRDIEAVKAKFGLSNWSASGIPLSANR